MQTLYTISVPTLCKMCANIDIDTDKNTAFCTSRVAFIAKTASITKSVSVQVYTKPVNCTSVHKTSLVYMCTQNQLTVQVYTKLVDCTSVHKTSLLVNNERNVHGQNI